jgi:protein-S-isoprenylcysteine O-methyltransferase Ste14
VIYGAAFAVLWVSWGVYWWLQSRGTKTNVWRESVVSRLLHIVPLVVAGLLLMVRVDWAPALNRRFVPLSFALFWLGYVLACSGLAFTIWARRHLGGNWSGTVTVKSGHELITTGPYAVVRHPIYTGLLLGFAGSGLAIGEWRVIVALVIVTVALWRKLRIEEGRMRQQFGDVYAVYARHVAALIPFLL